MAYQTGIMPLKAVHTPPYTIESPGCEPVENETLPRRHPKAKDGLVTSPAEDVKTLFDIVRRSAKKYPDEPAMGYRSLVKIHKERKKVPKIVDGETIEVEKEWQFFELSKYSFITYKELETLALQLGAGLRKLGLKKGSRVHLFASTRYGIYSILIPPPPPPSRAL
jgi:long-chain acyl-CoA synthetase